MIHDDHRPDPDALLARIRSEEAKTSRGRLKIFFGAAPGVGKTYAMLEAARKVAKEGADLVVGYVEPHVRPETQALVLGLELLARKSVDYRGATLQEFDLEAGLARKPKILVVDELAHTNAPGVTHEKRWQDIEDLLQAGVDVYTTLNVQHLESVNDIVAKVTGVTVRETVPDRIFEGADEVELVDLPPGDLIERIEEGKVYVPGQAARAVQNFFRKGNLIALRELALRRMADRVNTEVRDYRTANAITRTWPTSERLLVCVGPSPLSANLIRATNRLAQGLHCPWIAAHVEEFGRPIDAGSRDRLERNIHLAEQLGAEVATLAGTSTIDELLAFARHSNVTRIIVGKPREPKWRELIRGSFVYELTRQCGDIDVHVISGDSDDREPRPAPVQKAQAARQTGPYLSAAGLVAVETLGCYLLRPYLAPVNLMMVYLVGLVAIALRLGRGPSVLGSILSVAAFDFLFVPPYYTFAVHDTQYVFTFAAMLTTGLVISTLASRLRVQVEVMRQREIRTTALYELSRDLASARSGDEIGRALVLAIDRAFGAGATLLVPDDRNSLAVSASRSRGNALADRDIAVADWVYRNGEKAGLGTSTLPGSKALFLPLLGAERVVGVVGVHAPQAEPAGTRPGFRSEQVQLLEAMARQAAAALDRQQLAGQAEEARVAIETERLRNALLSAVSHDLRTPLAAIAGGASTLLEGGEAIGDAVRKELLASICDESEGLNRMVGNLLDLTRLEAGAIRLHKDWESLEEVLGVVLNRLSRVLQGHRVEIHIPPDLPLVEADGLLLQQVLLNLIENAAKYAPPGTAVDVTAAPSADSREMVVEVSDRGPGLRPGEERSIFERFERSAAGRGRQGVGLGLTICRGIVALHGGAIRAENRPGGGTTVTFRLPLETPAPIPDPDHVPGVDDEPSPVP